MERPPTPHGSTTPQWIVYGAAVHVLLIMKGMIEELVPDEPDHVADVLRRHEFIVSPTIGPAV